MGDLSDRVKRTGFDQGPSRLNKDSHMESPGKMGDPIKRTEPTKAGGGVNWEKQVARDRTRFEVNDKGQFESGNRNAFERVRKQVERVAKREAKRYSQEAVDSSKQSNPAQPKEPVISRSAGVEPSGAPEQNVPLRDYKYNLPPPPSGSGVVVYHGGGYSFKPAPSSGTWVLGCVGGAPTWLATEDC